MIDVNRLCPYCFSETDLSAAFCPHCEKKLSTVPERSSRSLPQYTILAGRYLIGRVLGEGGFGITYLAMDLVQEKKVAVKEYFPVDLATRDLSSETQNSVLVASGEASLHFHNGMRRFESEALTLRKLELLPGIVSILDFFSENNTAYLVMKYIEGGNLKQYLKSYTEKNGQTLPYTQALTLMRPVLDSLQKIHAAGIIHRDISPENILMDENGKLVLIDFGSSKTNLASRENRSMTVMVKHGYAPEEQYRTHGDQGPWTDIYAVCATLYHMISGILPEDAIERLIDDKLVPLKSLNLSSPIPAAYSDIIEKGMRTHAKYRYQSIEELIADLEKADRAAAEAKRKAEEEARQKAKAEIAEAEAARKKAEEERAAAAAEKQKAEIAARRKAEEAKRQSADTEIRQNTAQKNTEPKAKKPRSKRKLLLIGILALAVILICVGPVRTSYVKHQYQKRLGSFLSSAKSFTLQECDIDGVLEVWKADNNSGCVIIAESQGYSGPLTITLGVSADGSIKGYGMDFSKETKGYGNMLSGGGFFKNLSGMNIRETGYLSLAEDASDRVIGGQSKTSVSNKVDAVSGATISCRAFVDAINLAIEAFYTLDFSTDSQVEEARSLSSSSASATAEKSSISSLTGSEEPSSEETEEKAIDPELIEKCVDAGLSYSKIQEMTTHEIYTFLEGFYLETEQWLAAAIIYGKMGIEEDDPEALNTSLALWHQYGFCDNIALRGNTCAAITENGTVKMNSYAAEKWNYIVSIMAPETNEELYGLKCDGTLKCTNYYSEKFGALTDVIALATAVNGPGAAALCLDGTIYLDSTKDGELITIDEPGWHDIRYLTGGWNSLIGVRKDGVIVISLFDLHSIGEDSIKGYKTQGTIEISDFTDITIKKIKNYGNDLLILDTEGHVHIIQDPLDEPDNSKDFILFSKPEMIQEAESFTDIVDIDLNMFVASFLHKDGTVTEIHMKNFGGRDHISVLNSWDHVSDISIQDYAALAILFDGTVKALEYKSGHGMDSYNEKIQSAASWTGLRTRTY